MQAGAKQRTSSRSPTKKRRKQPSPMKAVSTRRKDTDSSRRLSTFSLFVFYFITSPPPSAYNERCNSVKALLCISLVTVALVMWILIPHFLPAAFQADLAKTLPSPKKLRRRSDVASTVSRAMRTALNVSADSLSQESADSPADSPADDTDQDEGEI